MAQDAPIENGSQAMTKKPLLVRGVQEIRTAAARSGAQAPTHSLHMRLCVLEMERHRRDQERMVALTRAAKCQARCEQIEQEVQSLLAQINRRGLQAAPGMLSKLHTEPKPLPRVEAAGFRHRY
jgi:hypothetical protein